jgi:hypothetical protein
LLPTATRESVTAQAAANFAKIAVALRRQYDERRVAHFINKLVFCLFARDIDLLPDRICADLLDELAKRPDVRPAIVAPSCTECTRPPVGHSRSGLRTTLGSSSAAALCPTRTE